LNNLAHSQQSINFYLLIKLLHIEARNVNLQAQFLGNGAILRYQRATYKRMQGIIMKAWDDLAAGNASAKQLLKLCAKLNGPSVSLD
jgi:hypothetical protein